MSKVIFLVDDEPLVVRALSRMLGDEGYVILPHDDPTKVVARFNAGERPDLLITDHDMPEMTGFSLAAAARELGYQGPILVLSARASQLVATKPASVTHLGEKTMGMSALCSLVARLMTTVK